MLARQREERARKKAAQEPPADCKAISSKWALREGQFFPDLIFFITESGDPEIGVGYSVGRLPRKRRSGLFTAKPLPAFRYF